VVVLNVNKIVNKKIVEKKKLPEARDASGLEPLLLLLLPLLVLPLLLLVLPLLLLLPPCVELVA
jgi:hypothetical protein